MTKLPTHLRTVDQAVMVTIAVFNGECMVRETVPATLSRVNRASGWVRLENGDERCGCRWEFMTAR